ncbi:MAG: tRNA (adenosine(37)-N6)-threonylcarbamoyltransferase complex dimerization subunit type 1 TsaB [Desulfobacterales bacterium]|nr:MAG: tRNA (adenosine(37)-N6)-threonylcarbamoyltransferase complex dimerization subunit type 1 TsaB [Desulfobacterales bacterium]
MKILAVDTATISCSVAVIDKETLLAESTMVRQQTHSKHLMGMIDYIVGLSGLAISELDGFAVTSGPGTFTGLRIGMSAIKGLAMATGKPVVGVSSLDALAMQAAPSPYLICPLIDARREEVYFSTYKFEGGYLKRQMNESVMPPEDVIKYLDEPCVFLGSGALLYQKMLKQMMNKTACFIPPFKGTIKASTVAYLSMYDFESDDTDDIKTLVPYYIRKPDAEMA